MDLANQEKSPLMQHIEDLTHRIEFKGTLEQPKQEDIGKINQSNGSNIATDPRSEKPNEDGLTTAESKHSHSKGTG